MTVWIVNPFDNLPAEGCRPQRYWLMADAFARAGHRVVLWTSDFSHATKRKRACPAAGTEPFEVIQIPTRPYPRNICWARVRSHRRLARDFERLARARLASAAPALLIASTPPIALCDAARRVAGACGSKFACDVQDAWPETFERLLPRGFKWLGTILFAPMRARVRCIYRTADAVTGVSARYAGLTGRSDFYLAYHGIAAGAGDLRRTGAADGPRTRLVYIGNLGAGYDLETAIEAVARRASLSLDIAGLGPREADLRAYAAARRLGGRVRFHGYLGADALQALLVRCDAGVIPMRDDSWVGLPYKLGDYLKAGLPVLSSLGGECGELLARTDSGRTYARGDADSLLRALDALPSGPVTLPPELRAERIYPELARHLIRRNENEVHSPTRTARSRSTSGNARSSTASRS